jgi:hypothetical protein
LASAFSWLAFISASIAFRNSMSAIFVEWHCKIYLGFNNRSNPITSDTKLSRIYCRNRFLTPECHV